MITMTEADMDMLADYEEEQQRKGHFTLLFPRAGEDGNRGGRMGIHCALTLTCTGG